MTVPARAGAGVTGSVRPQSGRSLEGVPEFEVLLQDLLATVGTAVTPDWAVMLDGDLADGDEWMALDDVLQAAAVARADVPDVLLARVAAYLEGFPRDEVLRTAGWVTRIRAARAEHVPDAVAAEAGHRGRVFCQE